MATRRNSRQTDRRRRARANSQARRSLSNFLYRRRLRYEPLEDRRVLAVVTVNTLADTIDFNDGVTSLREAIFATNLISGADTIDFAPSLTSFGPRAIVLALGELKISDSLTIKGTSDRRLTIDASGNDLTPNANNGDGSRIFRIDDGTVELVDVSFEGLTLTGGDIADFGGAIYGAENLNINNCTITGNSAIQGGGLFTRYADLTISDSTISNNYSTQWGGGIHAFVNNGHSICLRDTFIVGNSTSASANTWGGGAYLRAVNGSSVGVTRLMVIGNTAHRGGGGLYLEATDASAGLIEESTFAQNSSTTREGGGLSLSLRNSEVLVLKTTIAQNSAAITGGIAANLVKGTLTLEQSTISGNTATDVGGLAITSNSTSNGAILRYCTVTNNTAIGPLTNGIGGVYAEGEDLVIGIEHTIIAGNHVTTGATVDFSRLPTVHLDVHYSLIGDGSGSGLAETLPGIADSSGNLIGGAVFGAIDPRLAPLADNGGLTLTHILSADSPAINAGNPNLVAGMAGAPLLDQRGMPFSRVLHGQIDIGATEYFDFLVDTLVDESDGDFSQGDVSLREAIELANLWSSDDTIRFDPALTVGGSATILLTQGELVVTDDTAIIGPGANTLTIDASGNDPTPSINDRKGTRVIRFDDGSSIVTTNTISGLTLTGGDLYGSGGAIFSRENLTIASSLITGNAIIGDSRGFGGGVYADRPTGSSSVQLTVLDSTISGNSTDRLGGGIGTRRGVNLTITGSTIQNNSARYGGGVSSHDGSVTIMSSTLQSNSAGATGGGIYRQGGVTRIESSNIWINSADFGGGIEIASGEMTIVNSTFNSNQAVDGDGGAIRNRGGSLSVTSSFIHLNSAQRDGGAIFGPASIARCEISANYAERNGGAIFSDTLVVSESYLVANTADQDGGAIYSFGGNLDINASTIDGNRATNSGGGIFFRAREIEEEEELEAGVEVIGEIIVRSSTVTGNLARFGGGFYGNAQTPGAITIQHSTVVYNRAETIGGGVYIVGDGLTIDHTILSSNSAPFGRNITGLIGTSFGVMFSLIGHNANSGLAEAPIGSPDANGNLIGGDTHGFIDPLLEMITLPGESTWINTMYMFGLLPGSPAIDAGDPTAVAGLNGVPVYDQRGAPYTRVFGWRIDIGAFERQPEPLPGDYNYDSAVNAADFVVWRKFLGTSNGVADGDKSGVVDQLDGDIWSSNFGSAVDSGSTTAAALVELERVPSSATREPTLMLGAAADVNRHAAERLRPESRITSKRASVLGDYAPKPRIDLMAPTLRGVSREKLNVDFMDDSANREKSPDASVIDVAFENLFAEAINATHKPRL